MAGHLNTQSDANSHSKFNAWLLLPSIFPAISLGFLGLLIAKHAYFEIKAVEYEDISFLSLKIVLGLAGFGGFFARRLLSGAQASHLELTLIFIALLDLFIIHQYSSGILQVDYIFHTSIFQFISFNMTFLSGFYLGSLKKLRLWAFLIGGVSVFGYSYFYKPPELNSELYLVPILCFLVIDISMFGFIAGYNKINFQKKKFYNNHPTTDVFFYSAITLLVSQLLLFYYRSNSGPDAIVAGGGLGLLIFNILFNLNFFSKKIRWLYTGGRIAIVTILALTVQQDNLDQYYFWIFFMDMALIAVFRPKKYNTRFLSISVLSGIIIAYVSYKLHLVYTKTEFLYAFLLVIVVLVWLTLVLKNEFGILQKIVLLVISYIVALYFFSPLPMNYTIAKSDRKDAPPLPFLMSSIELNSSDFIYYNTNLPFKNSTMLPKRGSFKNKVIVLGIRENPELVLTYVKYLDKNLYPYLIFQNRNLSRLSKDEINFTYQEYPLFRVYYPEKGIPGLEMKRPQDNQSWESELVDNRLKDLSSNEEIIEVLNNLVRYSSGEVVRVAKRYQEKFFKSYKRYSEFYFENKNYRQAIAMASLAINYDIEDNSLFETIYESLIRISPEISHIPIMKKLIQIDKYRIETLSRLYPLLLSSGEEKEAIYYMDILLDHYRKQDDSGKLSLLIVEKIKIHIKNKKYSEAEDILQKEKYRYPDLNIWAKLSSELKYYKETSYRPYYYGVRISNDN